MKLPESKTSLRRLISLIAVIALPVALQNLLTTTGTMIDTMMIASLGEKSVGAVGLCAQYSNLMYAGYWGFVGGGMLFFSQFWGAGNEKDICHSYGMTVCFMMISGVVCGSLAVFRPDLIMKLYTGQPKIREIGIQYLRIVGFSFPLQVIATAMSALLRSVERVRLPLYGGIAGVICNCTCNYILIFGKLGFPAMGVRGAAVGTVIASLVNVLVILIGSKVRHLPFILEFREHFRWNRALLSEYLRKSFPILMNEVFIGIGNMMVAVVLGHQIPEAIAATAVLRTLEGLIVGFFAGFSNAASVVVGKEVGAGSHEEAFSRAWRLIYLCMGMIGIVDIALLAVHTPLLHAMGMSGKSFQLATGMLIIFSVVALIRMANWCMNDTFRSGGDSRFGSVMELTFMFLMVQPVIHIANDLFHVPFLLLFALCYVDEPIRFFIMQRHMYSAGWIKPVSEEGKKTIGSFRKKYGVPFK